MFQPFALSLYYLRTHIIVQTLLIHCCRDTFQTTNAFYKVSKTNYISMTSSYISEVKLVVRFKAENSIFKRQKNSEEQMQQ